MDGNTTQSEQGSHLIFNVSYLLTYFRGLQRDGKGHVEIQTISSIDSFPKYL